MKSNLDPKVASAVSYAPFIGWIAATIFLIIEKDSGVRFHAAQALVLALASWVLLFVMGVTIVLALLTPVVGLATLVVQVVLMVKTYQGEKIILPVLGEWAKKVLEVLAPKKSGV